MDICEIFAQNIQIPQLKSVLSTDRHTTEGVEEERKNFLGWLKEQFRLGLQYSSQLDAWYWYKLSISFSEFDEEDIEDQNWMADIEAALDNQVSIKNYNEFGGQQ